ncbi:MAG: flippase-like domain-containing protein, partial [Anaerolineaceae bacterium]|nr:flippase-like domain-containing protein [Anaerolineaceae bacterium]
VSLFARVFAWYILLQKRVSFKDAFFAMNAGYLLNNVFPFRLGEIGRALLLDRPEGPKAFEVLSSVVMERVFDVFLGAVFVLATLPRVIGGDFDQRLIWLALVLTVMGLIVLFLMARNPERINGWLVKWGERSTWVKNRLAPRVAELLTGLAVLKSPSAFILAFGSLALSWVISFGENYIIFNQLQPNPPFWWLIFVLSMAAFGAALPSAPAGLGVFEGVMVTAFALLGVNPDLAFTHAVVIHALAIVFTGILGLIGLRLQGQALVSLYQRAVHRAPAQIEGE